MEPSFVDTDHDFGNITEMIRKNVNKKTGGILAVHNFGIPGELELIEKLAEELGSLYCMMLLLRLV